MSGPQTRERRPAVHPGGDSSDMSTVPGSTDRPASLTHRRVGAPPTPSLTAARWFEAGLTTGEHQARTLEGTFAAGYDDGYANGYRDGYTACAEERQAQHAALWAELGPRIEAGVVLPGRRRARWPRVPDEAEPWDAAAQRLRCAQSWDGTRAALDTDAGPTAQEVDW